MLFASAVSISPRPYYGAVQRTDEPLTTVWRRVSGSLAGYPPFSPEYKDMPLQEQILRGRFTFQRRQWRGVSETAKDLVRRLLTVDPALRITVEQALAHPWLQVSSDTPGYR